MNGFSSFYWHDYETFGIDPRRDRPAQFAGQRTNADLEPVGEPLAIYCKPPRDVLPSPVSCLVTGITPQQADRVGVIEAEFAARIHEELAEPGTCAAGFNSIRFDDEFTRNLLYRNFYDPYAREWENGNSRWDVIDLARMCYALRPGGIEWPMRTVDRNARSPVDAQTPAPRDAISVPSFRLEDLTAANGIGHEHAHDALSDVNATIALARLLRARQPRLFAFYFALRRKQRAFELLDCLRQEPVLHVSSRYPPERGCMAMVVPLAVHPQQPNKVIVYDLDTDPAALLELDPADIADRVFTPRADLPEGVERVPLKAVSANRSPALAPVSALAGVDTTRIRLDPERCRMHLQRLREAAGIGAKVIEVFALSAGAGDEAVDPDLALYHGFMSDADRKLLRDVRGTPPPQLATRPFAFRDARCSELLFRYRARNWPSTLSLDESARWEQHRRVRLTTQTDASTLTLDDYFREIALRRTTAEAAQVPILDALEQWGREILQD
jgi:exodeoxyribonuclease-1